MSTDAFRPGDLRPDARRPDAFRPADFPPLRPAAGAEHERARARGYADGHAEGYRAGSAAAAAELAAARSTQAERETTQQRYLDEALTALQAVSHALNDHAAHLGGASARRVVDGAIELAEVILDAELADDETSATAAIRRAMSASAEAEVAAHEVRVSREDLRTLERVGAVIEEIALVADDALSPGDAVVVFDDGCIDLRIDAALERARRAADGEELP